MKLQSVDQLKEGYSYNITNRKSGKEEVGVFRHIGQTGMPIFHPPGEPSFQDLFGLNGFEENWDVNEIGWLRDHQ